jgi:hypothetical protein
MLLRRSSRILAALLALVVLVVAAIALVGISVDAQRWRVPVAEALSRALGREVRLDGPVRLTLSLRPAIVLGDIRIANPPGFDAPEFARIGELRLVTELLPLLREEIRVRDFHSRDVSLSFARSSDGRANWIFETGAKDAAPRGPFTLSQLDVHRLVIENLLIEYADGSTARQHVLAELELEARTGQSVRLALRGAADPQYPYTVRVTSAALSGLGGEKPWPFDIQVSLPGTMLTGSGAITGPLAGPRVQATFGAGKGEARNGGQPASGTTAVSGDLALDLSGKRPHLAGRLAIPELDLRSLPLGTRAAGAGPVKSLAEAFDAVGRVEFDLKPVAIVDADVELVVARWAGVPGDVRDLSARLRIDAGTLVASYSVTIAGARFEGDVTADGTTATPRLRAHLVAREAPLGGLAELLFDAPYVAGSVRRFEVTLDARGNSLGELVGALEGRINIADAQLTYGNYAGGRPVAMHLDAAAISQPRGRTIAGDLRGSLRGKAFDGKFRAGTVEQILRGRRTPFGFDGTSGPVVARLSGTLAEPTDRTGPEIAFEVTAPRARELTPWLGFSSESDARVALKGIVQVRQRHGSLTGASLLVGRTSLTGEVAWQEAGGRALVKSSLYAELLAPAELRSVAAPTARRATLLEIPILPESLDFADSDLELRVKRVDGLPIEIADIAFQGRMRGGEITPSPFSLHVEGNVLSGTLALDARGELPTASLSVAGHDVDVGPLLRRLRVARDVESRIGTVRLHADIRERRLGDVLEQSSFVARIESGTLDFLDTNTRTALRIAVKAGEVRADAGAPVTASITGTTGVTPVTLEIRAARLREFVEPAERLPFSLNAKTPGVTIAISGSAAPQRNPDVALSLALSGKRLDGLGTLLEASLPPWGPYALTGRLRFSKRGYQVDALRLALGDSVLAGSGAFDTARAPPRLDAAFAAERIQLKDFPLGEWSPFEAPTATGQRLTVESAREAVGTEARRVHAIFSQELMRRIEGEFALSVKQVLSGRDELGRGLFRAKVENGRATIGPVEIEGSHGGSVRGSLVYEPRDREVVVEARVLINRFGYGRLARTIRPESKLDGTLSLDVRLDATAPRLSDALAVGSGRFDFAVWPERVTGSVFDFWTVNLLFRLLPFFDASASYVNCAVGHFDLERGRLQSLRLVIDTANSRTQGSGTAYFATSEIGLRFVPRPKVPQFFSLATPVELSGTFDDYRIRVRPTDVLGTIGQWVTSLVTVPFQRMFGARIPADGHDVCANPGR